MTIKSEDAFQSYLDRVQKELEEVTKLLEKDSESNFPIIEPTVNVEPPSISDDKRKEYEKQEREKYLRELADKKNQERQRKKEESALRKKQTTSNAELSEGNGTIEPRPLRADILCKILMAKYGFDVMDAMVIAKSMNGVQGYSNLYVIEVRNKPVGLLYDVELDYLSQKVKRIYGGVEMDIILDVHRFLQTNKLRLSQLQGGFVKRFISKLRNDSVVEHNCEINKLTHNIITLREVQRLNLEVTAKMISATI